MLSASDGDPPAKPGDGATSTKVLEAAEPRLDLDASETADASTSSVSLHCVEEDDLALSAAAPESIPAQFSPHSAAGVWTPERSLRLCEVPPAVEPALIPHADRADAEQTRVELAIKDYAYLAKAQETRAPEPLLTPPRSSRTDTFPFTGDFAGHSTPRDRSATSALDAYMAYVPSPLTNIFRRFEGNMPMLQTASTALTAPLPRYLPRVLRPRYSVDFSWGDEQPMGTVTFRPLAQAT